MMATIIWKLEKLSANIENLGNNFRIAFGNSALSQSS